MDELELTSYLRSLRKRAGLSLDDLAGLIGYVDRGQVSRHERAENLPSLLVALSYEAVFRVPVAEIFPGIFETVQLKVEDRLARNETALQQSKGSGRRANSVARQLEWRWEREQKITNHHDE